MLPGHEYCCSAARLSLSIVSMRLRERLRELLDEAPDQQRNVFDALPQRRHVNRKDVQAVEQVLAERALGDPLLRGSGAWPR